MSNDIHEKLVKTKPHQTIIASLPLTQKLNRLISRMKDISESLTHLQSSYLKIFFFLLMILSRDWSQVTENLANSPSCICSENMYWAPAMHQVLCSLLRIYRWSRHNPFKELSSDVC